MSESTDHEYTAPDISLVGAEHVRRYEETDGEVGHQWNGVQCLVLTSSGRRTGQPRKSALIYAKEGEDYVVVASMGGAPMHPSWFLNVQANPSAVIQVGAETVAVVARTAEAGERVRLWEAVTEVWPNYDVYAARTDRQIPVVVLHPVGTP